MNIWNQEKYIKAWNFASTVHNGQLVPGTKIPYINHIGLVAMESMSAIATQNELISSPDLLVLCAVLHDTIEDTDTTFQDIQNLFDVNIANGVQALSKKSNLSSKKEKMKDSLERIKLQPKEISMVKMADRITNLQPPPTHWKKEKIKNYRNEAIMILEELGGANQYLSARLQTKIIEYQKFE